MNRRGWIGIGALTVLVMMLVASGCSGSRGAVKTTAPGAEDAAAAAGQLSGMEDRGVMAEEIQPIQPQKLEDVYFNYDRFDLTPESREILADNATWLENNPGSVVQIEGHCDDRGSNEYNIALGDRRAKSVLNYLVTLGISSSRLSTISYGEEKPQCFSATEECWAQNRRAHFSLQ
ncbi:MAG: peptidoglycan-associated lipoprotein Pal [bacterium]|nr:peptidoglycan-associated lipoprotein Pal [bacterium]